MTQILASIEDINGQLPVDNKAVIQDGDDGQLQIDARAVIKGQLSSVFTPSILIGWDSPANTPTLIRSIAGRLIASKWYAELYAGDSDDANEYAANLYQEALGMLAQIRDNTLIVLDDNDEPISTNLLAVSTADFYPNDDTTDGPYFTMAGKW